MPRTRRFLYWACLSHWTIAAALLLCTTSVARAQEIGLPSESDEHSLFGDAYDTADPDRPWYISISGGMQQRERVHEVSDARTFIEFEQGFVTNAALGYRFDTFRVEAEYSFLNNECERAGAVGISSPTVGNVNLRATMFNIYHDVKLDNWFIQPYVGGGIGIYQSEINGLFPEFFQLVGPPFSTTPINATSNFPFAYQFRAGFTVPMSDRADFYCGYRYFHGEKLTFSSAPFASGLAPFFNPNAAVNHAVEFGIRVYF
jgi:opacity protein-like surface antigen